MPFKKLGANRFRGPSGKVFNRKQVRLYYARGGKFCWRNEKGGLSHKLRLKRGGESNILTNQERKKKQPIYGAKAYALMCVKVGRSPNL